jgi:hypothetical protein
MWLNIHFIKIMKKQRNGGRVINQDFKAQSTELPKEINVPCQNNAKKKARNRAETTTLC